MAFSNRTSSASNIFEILKILKVSDLYCKDWGCGLF